MRLPEHPMKVPSSAGSEGRLRWIVDGVVATDTAQLVCATWFAPQILREFDFE